MKKIKSVLTALFLLLFTVTATSQTIKNPVLIEEISNTGCIPCAAFSEILDTLVSYRLGDVISVKYHGYVPDKRDVFYNNLKDEMDKKLALYNVTAYPTTVVNGHYSGNSLSLGQLKYLIDKYAFTDPQFDIELSGDIADHNLHVKAVVTPKADTENPDLRLHVMVIEEYYENPAVFRNGETFVRNITRKMLPDGDGFDMSQALTKGTPYTYQADWAITNFGDERQLALVAFVQDMKTREVVATAYLPRKTEAQNNLRLMNVEDTPDNVCTPDFYGTVTFRNEGANRVTSAKLNVSLNGKTHVYDWTGDLSRLDRQEFKLSGITDFDLVDQPGVNTAEVWLSDINGSNSESNRFTLDFKTALKARNAVMLRIFTDERPQEIIWKVFDSAGEVVASGGPYSEQRKAYIEKLPLTTDDCYTLTFYDTGGNGITGYYGSGFFELYQLTSDHTRTLFYKGDYTGRTYSLNFSLVNADPSAGITPAEAASQDPSTSVTLYDTDGKMIGKTTAGAILKSNAGNGRHGVTIVRSNAVKSHKVMK